MSLLGVPNFGVELAKHLDRELRRRTAVSEWQKIITHPRTSERFLASDGLSVWVTRYFPDMGFVDEGVPQLVRPTHWQYLPPPPEVK